MPELIVIRLKHEVAQAAINECYRQMKDGTLIIPSVRIAGPLGAGFECIIGDVSAKHSKEYMGWALWQYKGTNFRANQTIYPSTAGVFPWLAGVK